MDEVAAGDLELPAYDGPLASEKTLLASAKRIALFCAGLAAQKFAADLPEQQEVMGAIAEILAEVLVLESTLLRTEKIEGAKPVAVHLARYYAARSFRVIESGAERVLGAVAEGADLLQKTAVLRKLGRHEPVNTVMIGRAIAAEMVAAGQYAV